MVVGTEVVSLGLMVVECYLHKTFCHGPVYIVWATRMQKCIFSQCTVGCIIASWGMHTKVNVLSKHHHPMWKVWSSHCKSSNIFKSFYSIDIVSNHCMSIYKLIYWPQGRFFTFTKELTQKLLNSFLWTWIEDGSQTPLTFGVDTDKGTDQGTNKCM